MNILVTGNLGYVGSVLVPYLRGEHSASRIIGYDAGYFAGCLTTRGRTPESFADAQYFGDVREIPDHIIRDSDAIVCLAAISNDPIGKEYEGPTFEINQAAAVNIARRAIDFNVKSFVFASSCSTYGAAEGPPRTEEDPVDPLTAYAKSKFGAETELAQLHNSKTTITALRFATACGMSPRLRLDLVLNDFVACALTSKEITVLSDGTPWRPLIDVQDMSRAIDWAIQRHSDNGGSFLKVNAGSNAWNYQVKELADAVAKSIPGTKVSINTEAPLDKRSYRVNFDLFEKLASGFTPIVTLEESIGRLVSGLKEIDFSDADFRCSEMMRLKTIQKHRQNGDLSSKLAWTNSGQSVAKTRR